MLDIDVTDVDETKTILGEDEPPRAKLAEDTLREVIGHLPNGGEARDGQMDMASWAMEAIDQDIHAVIQAPTGTGKTLAYLVPAILEAKDRQKRIVVATATKALQDQLANKDLPFLQQHLGEFTYTVLKGRSNYLCKQRLAEIKKEREGQLGLQNGYKMPDDTFKRIVDFDDSSFTGDRADMPVAVDDVAWSQVSVGSEECPGVKKCPKGNVCFADRAKQISETVDVVIANHHLYAFSIKTRVLPEHQIVILDEAHQIEDTFANALSETISSGRFSWLANKVDKVGGSQTIVKSLRGVGEELEDCLQPLKNERLTDGLPDDLREILGKASTILHNLYGHLMNMSSSLLQGNSNADIDRVTHSGQWLAGTIAAILSFDDGYVLWVNNRKSPQLCATPIYIGEKLAEQVWPLRSAVLTSATIPPNTVDSLGLPPMTIEGDVESPFDLKTNALFYCSSDIPDPREIDSEARRLDDILRLIQAAEGRTLALFTSYKTMHTMAEAVASKVPWPILVQGSDAPAALRNRFAADEQASLFATMSFWEGIDVPGPSCSLVIIDKLPFARPDDPIMQAKREASGKKAFRKVDLPWAATRLAQGSGRLIRTSTDKGVIAILDSRLMNANYGSVLKKHLPPIPWTEDLDEAVEFLRGLRAENIDTEQVAA